MLRPGRRGLLPGRQLNAITQHPQDSRDCSTDPVGHAQARPSIISDLLGAWQALHHGQWAIEILEQAVRRTACSALPSAICP